MPKPDFSNGLYVKGRRNSKYRLGDLSHVVAFQFQKTYLIKDWQLRFGLINGRYHDYIVFYRHPDPLRRCVIYSGHHYYKYLEKIK